MVEASNREIEREKDQTGPLFDFDSNESPIYLQLITIFRRQISQGMWPLNTRIPTIENLAAQYGVANGTVRQALSFLEQEGLIRRMRRRGTYVIKLPEQPDPITLPRTRDEFEAMLNGLKSVTTPGMERDGDGMRRSTRTYSRGSITVMLESERADPDRVPEGSIALAGLNSAEFKNSRIDQVVTIGTADTETARQLGIPVNAAVALVGHKVTDPDGLLLADCEWLLRGDLLLLVEHYPGPGGAR